MIIARSLRYLPRRLRGVCAAIAGLSALSPAVVIAATCHVAASPFAFGAYDTVDQLDVSDNTITVTCRRHADQQGSVVTWSVRLSSGSGTYGAREMTSGTGTLLYNLYTSAARTVVWGDGTAGTGAVTGSITFGRGNNPISVVHAVHGRIPGDQNVVPGVYTTANPIVVSVDY